MLIPIPVLTLGKMKKPTLSQPHRISMLPMHSIINQVVICAVLIYGNIHNCKHINKHLYCTAWQYGG